MRLFLALLLALALAAPAAAQDKTIYSSLPLQGALRSHSQDIVRAMTMAVEDAGAPVRYVSLDGSTATVGTWDPRRVARNAQTAARDATTVAYLGEFTSGATAVSLPILNEAGILQISPGNTYVGLTRAGGEAGEPDRYYPTGSRTYGRVSLADHIQANALLAYARERGRRRIAVVHDAEVYGRGLALMIRRRAPAYGIRVVAFLRHGRGRPGTVARRVRRTKADAMVFGGITANGAAGLWRAVHARNPRLDLFGVDGVANEAFTRRIPRSSRARTFITNMPLAASAYPPAGQDFLRRFRDRHGRAPDAYAIFGYEAMALAIDAVRRGGATREGAIDAFFTTRDRASVLGTYSIDAYGDSTLATYGGYRVTRSGRLRFDKVLLARP